MTHGIASLGMYDHPAQQAANDRLWTALARVLERQGVVGVPDRLDRTRDVHAIWRDPALLFGQACGYPLIADGDLTLRVVALPVYAAPGCGDAMHASVLVARDGDGRRSLKGYRGARAAINDRLSNSGMNLFRAAISPLAGRGAFFRSVTVTGSHHASVRAVVAGEVDIAAIDAVTYAALDRFEPSLIAPLKIVAHSPSSPTLPFVTAASTGSDTVAALRIALDTVLADPALAADRQALFLTGIVPATAAALAPIAALEDGAIRDGYPDLR